MNTLTCIGAILATGWLSIYFFSTVDENALGVVCLVAFLWLIPWTLMAAIEDNKIRSGTEEPEE